MNAAASAGSIGSLQLLAFVDSASGEAVRTAASELAYAQVRVEPGNVTDATKFLKENPSPEILIVQVSSAEEAPAQLDALADVVNPVTRVLVAGTTDSVRFYQWLSDLGIDGYLLMPFTAVELKQAIARGSIKKQDGADTEASVPKKIVAVIGTRGGIGTSMFASNLAEVIAREHKLATALVDLDPYFGTAALGMDLEAGRGLRDAFEKPDRVDGLFLERVMVKPFEGLSVLGAEEPLSDVLQVQPNAGEAIFAALKEKFTLIVADLPRQMNPLTRHVLSIADYVMLVADPQITSLRDALRLRDYVTDHLKRAAPFLILNRIGLSGPNELSTKEFAKNFGRDAAAEIAYMPEVIAATNEGAMIHSVERLKPLMAPLRSIAQIVTGSAPPPEEAKSAKGGLLGLLKGKK